MFTRSSLGFGIALLLALPGCERLLGLSELQRPCEKRSCSGLCGQVEDGCGGRRDCGPCTADGGAQDSGTLSCEDEARNGSETDQDCGGPDCPACRVGMRCELPRDCGSGVCTSNVCEAAASCSNKEIDGTETDYDCGGAACEACPSTQVCLIHEDCLSKTCLFGICRDPTCSDKVRNQDETDVDCGGSCSKKCANGQRCTGREDCDSGLCGSGTCAPSCALDNGGCSPSADCANEPAGRVCTCKTGFEGDGLQCTDVDECQVNRGGCDPHATCTNTLGSRVCECNQDFSGDGLTCAMLPLECRISNGGCDPNAVCGAGPSEVTCTCKSGYVGDGKTCEPICRKPKVMITLDRSASMMQSLTSSSMLCTDLDGNYFPGSPNDCKWKDLRAALKDASGLLATTRGAAFYGLAAFPGSDQPDTCVVGNQLVSISDAGDNVDAVATALVSLIPAGGTPTAGTLEKLAGDPQLMQGKAGQARIVLLVTDGIPNCNQANESKCAVCKQSFRCGGGANGDECPWCFSPPCSATFAIHADTDCKTLNACLDGDNTVAAVTNLAAKGIKTFVIGFGSETSAGEAARILNRAAVEGGLARDNSFPTRFYQASTKAELERALAHFADTYIKPCVD